MKTSTPKSSKRKVVETDNVSPTVPTKQLFQREEQYFGFNPISFLDDISNAVDDFCASEVDQIEQEFEKYEEFKDSEKEIQNVTPNKKKSEENLSLLLFFFLKKRESIIFCNLLKIPLIEILICLKCTPFEIFSLFLKISI